MWGRVLVCGVWCVVVFLFWFFFIFGESGSVFEEGFETFE